MTIALVPLRSPGHGKTRLRHVLSTERRADLAGAMLADVVAALRAARIPRIVVAASGPAAVTAASALDLEVVLDDPQAAGLNAALTSAAARLGPIAELLVVAADLPRLTADDVRTVLESDAEVVVAPTRGGGTGGLVRRPGDRIATAYGTGSAQRHLDLADAVGARSRVVSTVGFRDDVDTGPDLTTLHDGPLGPATSRWLARHADELDAVV
jgi:2-phospho-L-lactate/phosphoenolpyruvate guanylyltransferase